jgi:hypothetical protein
LSLYMDVICSLIYFLYPQHRTRNFSCQFVHIYGCIFLYIQNSLKKWKKWKFLLTFLQKTYTIKYKQGRVDVYMVGSLKDAVVPYVVIAQKGGKVQIISARKAEPPEERTYYEHYRQETERN